MKRTNLDTKRDALEMLVRSAKGAVPVLVCPCVRRPAPKRRSKLTAVVKEMIEMRRAGKSLREIAVQVAELTGHLPDRSTVLRALRRAQEA